MSENEKNSAEKWIDQKLGNWIITQKLGQGGMATVFQGRHAYLPNKAAIKILHTEYSSASNGLKRFQQEAFAINELQHKNIVSLLDFGHDENNDCYFMVQEYLDGYDLEYLLQERAPLAKTEILQLMQQICSGLAVCHRSQFIHRDLKPSNIFLLPEEKPHPQVKILDFGIAKLIIEQKNAEELQLDSMDQAALEETLEHVITAENTILGTLTHIAPEQVSHQEELTPSIDIYALGVILYEMFTGELPLVEETQLKQLVAIITKKPIPAGDIRPELKGTKLEAFLARMLAKEPEQRPADMEQVWEELVEAANSFQDPLENSTNAQQGTSHFAKKLALSTPQDETPAAPNVPPTADTELPLLIASKTNPLSKTLNSPSIWQLLVLILLLGMGFFLYKQRSPKPIPTPKRSVKAKKPDSRLLNQLESLVAKGITSFKKKRYQEAAFAWKKVTSYKDWQHTAYYPALYKKIGEAFEQQKHLHLALRYYKRYSKAIQHKAGQSKAKTSLAARLLALTKKLSFNRKQATLVLQKLDKVLRQTYWQAAYAAYQELLVNTPSIPEVQQVLAQKLAGKFPIIARDLYTRILNKLEPSPKMRENIRVQRALLNKEIEKRGQEALSYIRNAKAAVVAGKSKKSVLRILSKLSLLRHLTLPAVHQALQKFLKSIENLNLNYALSFLEFYKKKQEVFVSKKLYQWLPKTDISIPSPEALSKQITALKTAKRLNPQKMRLLKKMAWAKQHFQAARMAFNKGDLRGAARNYRKCQANIRYVKKRDKWQLQQQLANLETQSKEELERTQKAQRFLRKGNALYKKAQFRKAFIQYEGLSKSLYGTPAFKIWGKRIAQKGKKTKKVHRQLQSATQFIQRKKPNWKNALKIYKSYLKRFPKAWNRAEIYKTIKICECAMENKPWKQCGKPTLKSP